MKSFLKICAVVLAMGACFQFVNSFIQKKELAKKENTKGMIIKFEGAKLATGPGP